MLAANTLPLEQLLLDEVHKMPQTAEPRPPRPTDHQKQIAAVEEDVKKIESPDRSPEK